MIRFRLPILIASLCVYLAASKAQEPGHFLRFPDVRGDKVVFSCEGDLWLGSLSAGSARRITSDEGLEEHAHFSPDGSTLAFTARYDGNTDVYVMPVDGGAPTRLTWTKTNVEVVGWTRDGKSVVYRSAEGYPGYIEHIYTVPAAGGPSTQLLIGPAGLSSFSPDGGRVAYTPYRVESEHWKRYHGGWADDVWIADLSAKTFKKITDYAGQDEYPVWVGGQIFFCSDRDGALDLYSYDVASGKVTRRTTHSGYDVTWPASDGKTVIYQYGAGLETYDIAANAAKPVVMTLNSDRIHARPRIVSPMASLTNFDIGPTGKRAVFASRGQISTVPAEHGDVHSVVSASGQRAVSPAWSPDGKTIAYVSDASGEQQLYVTPAEGDPKPRALTHLDRIWLGQPLWSPDGKKIAFVAQDLHLYIVTTGSKPVVSKAATARFGTFGSGINTYVFSPDSRYLAYDREEEGLFNSLQSVYIYDTQTGDTHRVTSGATSCYTPAFDPTGKYLYFLSDRNTQVRIGPFDFEAGFDKPTKAYLMVLAKDGKSPFLVDDDEEGAADKDEKKTPEPAAKGKTAGKDAKPKTPDAVKIDWDGLEDRTEEIPMPAAWYNGIGATDGKILLSSLPDPTNGASQTLESFDLKTKKSSTVTTGMAGWTLSADHKKLLLRKGDAFQIVDADAKDVSTDTGKLDLSGWQLTIDPAAEWRQIFEEVWRRERDFLYDPGMHQIDWPGIRKRYEALLPAVASRDELSYVLGELVGELNVSHAFVWGGEDRYTPHHVTVGSLGADLAPDPASGYFRITHLLRGDGFDAGTRSPLLAAGLNVKEGDYLLSVNGNPVNSAADPNALLVGLGGKVAALTVNDKPSKTGARVIRIEVMADDSGARYADWVSGRRAYVQKKNPRIAYIHLSDMTDTALNEFTRQYFANLDKDAMVLDVRYNDGGYVAPIILERLERKIVDYFSPRWGEVYHEHPTAFAGPIALVINERTISDGEDFTEEFRRVKRGKIIGARTWGGEVWISGTGLIDGGAFTAPGSAMWTPERKWAIEGIGCIPDVEVQNDPASVVAGQDKQLDKAVEVLEQELKEIPPVHPKPPAYEDRSGLEPRPIKAPAGLVDGMPVPG